ncbi:acetylornithine deacetylase [Roseivivax sp. GX 12232]|uniref:acetylornithine deacetylase n=1 Tax=Roseivivax sp. GX 12232 TaxID=2900547 RepID=UPI001E4ED2E2|nr:acetylornithine deacetylase [Roseivivax sp. GX 12232]MCE0505504.1 acetylornithine deacetylase [Roseivivax sp. GX 12232]
MSDLWTTETLLADLIAHPTVSSEPNRALIDFMANLLEDAGARVEVFADPGGGKANLFATLGPERSGGVVLSGHSDVVPVTDQNWTTDPFRMSAWEDALYGRGACDMKGFIAASLAMARHYAELRLRRPVHFCFTHDEEVGCLGAQALVPELEARAVKPAMAIVGEPTEMRLIEGHKGCCEYTATFTGLEGHGSAPDLGVNAVSYAVLYVTRLLLLADRLKSGAPEGSRFDPPWSTINIGKLAGGHAHNVIPGFAEVQWEMRPVQPADARYVKDNIRAYVEEELLPQMRAVHPDADVVTEVIGEVTGLEPLPENAARDLVAKLTGANGADLVPFNTEAGLLQDLGMSVVVCGPGSIAQAHKPDEFVSRDQLSQCLDMLRGLGAQLAA